MSGTRENSGSLAKNDRKEKDTHPDIKGRANITCPHCQKAAEYWLDAWMRENERGKWYSVSFKPKNPPADMPAHRDLNDNRRASPPDDLPF